MDSIQQRRFPEISLDVEKIGKSRVQTRKIEFSSYFICVSDLTYTQHGGGRDPCDLASGKLAPRDCITENVPRIELNSPNCVNLFRAFITRLICNEFEIRSGCVDANMQSINADWWKLWIVWYDDVPRLKSELAWNWVFWTVLVFCVFFSTDLVFLRSFMWCLVIVYLISLWFSLLRYACWYNYGIFIP